MKLSVKLSVVALSALLLAPAQAQTEIQWWHSMTGGLNDWVIDLANGRRLVAFGVVRRSLVRPIRNRGLALAQAGKGLWT